MSVIIVASFLINMISEFFIWFSDVEILLKSLFTVLFVVKFFSVCFFETVVNKKVFKKIGLYVGIVFNTLLLGMMSMNRLIVPSIGCALLLCTLLFVHIFAIKKSKGGKN